jgi:beta-glucosidase
LLQIDYTEGLFLDYRYMDEMGITPRFEFGFGLSYTTFAYSSLSISSSSDTYTISFTVANSGSLAGTEKPQLYLGYPTAAGEPKRVLRGFEEVDLGVGQSKAVSIILDKRGMRCVLFCIY